MKHIILASASPRRKEILELADLKFDVMPSDAQEITTKTAPNEVVMELASIKAKDIYKKSEKQSMVVGADTVVAYQGQILGKPADEADAKRMLTMLSGQTHEVYTGVCVIEDGKTKTFYEETKVTFYEISDEQIDRYIKTGEPMDKAGLLWDSRKSSCLYQRDRRRLLQCCRISNCKIFAGNHKIVMYFFKI